MTIPRLLLAACCVVVLAGCGGDQDDPAPVLQEFFTAVGEEDMERACELLAREQRIYDRAEGSCATSLFLDPEPAVVKEIEAGDYKLERVPQTGSTFVVVENQLGEYEFVKEDGDWRLIGISR